MPVENLFSMGKEGDSPPPYPLCSSEGKNRSFWPFFCAFCCILSDFSRVGQRLKRTYVRVENEVGPLLCASPILRAGQGLHERAAEVHAAAPWLRLCLAPSRRSCPRGGPARRSRQGRGPVGPGAAFQDPAAPALDLPRAFGRKRKGGFPMNANIKSATRREVYRRDGYRCALCDSSQGLQVHHAIPRGEGGVVPPSARARRAPGRRRNGPGEGNGRPAGRPEFCVNGRMQCK